MEQNKDTSAASSQGGGGINLSKASWSRERKGNSHTGKFHIHAVYTSRDGVRILGIWESIVLKQVFKNSRSSDMRACIVSRKYHHTLVDTQNVNTNPEKHDQHPNWIFSHVLLHLSNQGSVDFQCFKKIYWTWAAYATALIIIKETVCTGSIWCNFSWPTSVQLTCRKFYVQ